MRISQDAPRSDRLASLSDSHDLTPVLTTRPTLRKLFRLIEVAHARAYWR